MNLSYKWIMILGIFLWGLTLLCISEFYYDYLRPYLYLSIALILPFIILNAVRQWKKDKAKGIKEFKSSIYRMLVIMVVLIIIFFITKQNHI